jgi:alkylated DNA repair dioxygenase AlkB
MSTPVIVVSDFLNPNYCVDYFNELHNNLDWVQRENTPRKEYWTNTLNRSYTYGKREGIRTYAAQPENVLVNRINEMIADVICLPASFQTFEGCFLNLYETGRDALGWHADDDPGINHSRGIAIVTLYDEVNAKPREIHFREVLFAGSETEKAVFGPTEKMELTNGSLVIMKAGMQYTHQHKIPKAGFNCRPRISLTYRSLLTD